MTLLHYDIPQWIEAEGGYLNDQFPAYFARYAGMVFDLFGDSIPYYVTINEITHNANCAYLQGKYPPNHHSVQELCHVGYNLVIAHARAVAEFRKRKLNSKIGIVHTTNTVQTLLDTEEYRIARHRGDLFKNLWVTDPAILGHFPEDLPGLLEEAGIDLSFVKAEDLKLLSENTIDFLGQNCYTRTLVKPYVSGETNYYRDYEGKGEVLESWISGEEPHYVEKLPAGSYHLRETIAPDGYEKTEDVIFEVKDTMEIQTVFMYDSPVKETEPVPVETEVPDTEPAETEPVETEKPETEPTEETETETPETKVPETEETETETETKITETATSETSTSETPSSENSKKSNAPKTGDTTDRTVEVSVLLLSGTVLLAFWKKNRKSKKSNE